MRKSIYIPSLLHVDYSSAPIPIAPSKPSSAHHSALRLPTASLVFVPTRTLPAVVVVLCLPSSVQLELAPLGLGLGAGVGVASAEEEGREEGLK